MTLDLHPEDLIDRASAGTISEGEQRRLDAHLALCDVCRFEAKARDSFRAEDSDASLDLDALVAHALGSPEIKHTAVLTPTEKDAIEIVETKQVANGAPIVLTWRLRPQMQKRAILLIAAALVLISAQAIAGKWSVLRLFVPGAAPTATEGETMPSVEAPKHSSHAAKSTNALRTNAASVDQDSTDETAAPVAPAPVTSAAASPVPVASGPVAPAAPVVAAPHVTTFTSSSSSSSIAPHAAPAVDADKSAYVALNNAVSLFDKASRDRADGKHAAARTAYAQLFQRFPMSPEATLARATYGRMLLDDGDAEGALVQLDTYLAEGDSALREQAFAARATALGREARFDLEVQTWQRLLREYPNSLYSARAHERIDEVGSR